VVCTRDRPQALARCLVSLRRGRVRPREIVVVDNASRSGATEQVAAAMADVRYIREDRPGLAIARNTGVRMTSGDIVAFTDDDVVVDTEWIPSLLPPFANARVMAVTGTVFPGELATEAQRMAEERLWSFNREFRPRTFDSRYFDRMRVRGVPVWHIGAGANMAIRRAAFAHVGLFDERLGAGAAGCSEDSELWYRLLAGGWSCAYEPAAVVFHFHRAQLGALRRQWYAYMRGHVTALLVQFARYRHWGNLRRIALQLPLHYALWLREVVQRRGSGEGGLWWAALSGALAGIGYYVRHLRVPSRAAVQSNGDAFGDARVAERVFLRANPFPHSRTSGFFYREKMRAIHRVAPQRLLGTILEIGGGQSGLTALLYPRAWVVNLERTLGYAGAGPTSVSFVCGDATALPFPAASVDAVTLFDVLEHIPDDAGALREALRVLRPGGALLISSPNEHWRFPYYRAMRGLCPSDTAIMQEWGHVRRGYAVPQLDQMLAVRHVAAASFITPWTAISHDLAFSRLPERLRHLACAAIAPVVWLASLFDDGRRGTETVALWIKPHT
jgi:GT2 family glycosyltransferase/SAM-dependent methyltransferase